jgi:hypothetical protein
VGAISLLESPVSSLTINSHLHWVAQSRDAWHHFGDILAPQQVWKPIRNVPGTRDVTVEGTRDDGWHGRIQVRVQPSAQVTPYGIYTVVSDHFLLKPAKHHATSRVDFTDPSLRPEPPPPSSANVPHLLEILDNQWSACLDRAQRIFTHLTHLSRQRG